LPTRCHLALVPARSGSKGIPRKNIADLAGKPLLAWTIAAALASRIPLRVVASTDCPEIAQIARLYGAETPFLRPAELARDESPAISTIFHALDWLEQEEGYRPDTVLYLQPTSPFRTAGDIDAAFSVLDATGADSVIGVSEAHPHPYDMMQLRSDGRLGFFLSEQKDAVRRQDFPPAYAVNGAIFLTRTASIRAEKSLFPARTYPFVMPRERSLDIDSSSDLHLARLILSEEKSHECLFVARVA
jgi:CMP-N-acetylneuraminic acid synthetase